MKTDIEIAQSCTLLPITAIGAKLGLTEEQLECYGRYKAKLLPSATVGKPQSGKLILVTAINPTAAGEGKTTTSIGLADSLSALRGHERPPAAVHPLRLGGQGKRRTP